MATRVPAARSLLFGFYVRRTRRAAPLGCARVAQSAPPHARTARAPVHQKMRAELLIYPHTFILSILCTRIYIPQVDYSKAVHIGMGRPHDAKFWSVVTKISLALLTLHATPRGAHGWSWRSKSAFS